MKRISSANKKKTEKWLVTVHWMKQINEDHKEMPKIKKNILLKMKPIIFQFCDSKTIGVGDWCDFDFFFLSSFADKTSGHTHTHTHTVLADQSIFISLNWCDALAHARPSRATNHILSLILFFISIESRNSRQFKRNRLMHKSNKNRSNINEWINEKETNKQMWNEKTFKKLILKRK